MEPFSSLANVTHVSRYLVLLVGLLSFPVAPQKTRERAEFWLDTGLVLLGGGTLKWHLALHPTTGPSATAGKQIA